MTIPTMTWQRTKSPSAVNRQGLAVPLALAVALAAGMAATPAHAQSYKFKVLHTFHGKDGAIPDGLLARDDAGNLYGTTSGGGDGKGLCAGYFYGCGTAFKMNASGKLVWSHSFDFTNGADPMAGMTRDSAGHLYGTSVLGGDTTCYQYGCGIVFELGSTGRRRFSTSSQVAATASSPKPSLPATPSETSTA